MNQETKFIKIINKLAKFAIPLFVLVSLNYAFLTVLWDDYLCKMNTGARQSGVEFELYKYSFCSIDDKLEVTIYYIFPILALITFISYIISYRKYINGVSIGRKILYIVSVFIMLGVMIFLIAPPIFIRQFF